MVKDLSDASVDNWALHALPLGLSSLPRCTRGDALPQVAARLGLSATTQLKGAPRVTYLLVGGLLAARGSTRRLAVRVSLVLVAAKERRTKRGRAARACWSALHVPPLTALDSPSRTLRLGRKLEGGLDTRSAELSAAEAAASLMSVTVAPPSTSGSTWTLRCSMRSMSTSTPEPPLGGGASESASVSSYSSPKRRMFCLPPGGSTTLREGRAPVEPDLGSSSCEGSAISAWTLASSTNPQLTHLDEVGDGGVGSGLRQASKGGVLSRVSLAANNGGGSLG